MGVVTKTRTYGTNDSMTASNYNADRDEIIAGVNSVVNAQIPAGANIDPTKIADTALVATQLDTDSTMAADSDTKIATQKATKAAIAAKVINRGFAWFLDGTEVVRNEAGAKYIVPQTMTSVKVWYQCNSGTATIRLQKGTTDIVNSLSVSSTQGSTTSFSSASLSAGDILSLDITAASSPVGITVTLECTQ